MKPDGHKMHTALCPVCKKEFSQDSRGKPKSCSRSCARKLEWKNKEREGQIKGRYKSTSGYIMIRRPDHPRSYKNKWIFEHIIIMEQKLGRSVDRRERVHHINGKRDDNRPENLELWTLDHKDPPGVRVSDLAAHCPTCRCYLKE